MADMILGSIHDLKIVLREKDIPFFSDEELEWYVDKCGSYNDAAYELLLKKSVTACLDLVSEAAARRM